MIIQGLLLKFSRRYFRAITIWISVFTLLFYLWLDSQRWSYINGFSSKNEQGRQKVRAKWLTRKLINLGSAFIKLGQLISARPDVLPRNWIIELADLQDRVPPFGFEKTQEIIEKELGDRCKEIIDIDKKPLAAASIAQVHKACLSSGRKVIFKVQRPGLEGLFKLDLEIMQQVAGFLQKNKSFSKGRDWVAMAKECKKVLLKELDFKIEAQYAARFRQQFLDEPKIKVPGVVWELSTKKVLCLDYLPGIKINDQSELRNNNIDPSKIAELGASSYLKQLIQFGFFHADPHPGNLAVASDGSLIFYDFGMMGMLSTRLTNRIGSMVRAAALQDAPQLVKELQDAGLLAKGIDLGPVRRLIRIMLKERLTPPFDSKTIEKLSVDLYELVYGQPFRLPVELIFVMRALSTFEGVGRSLDPSFNLIAITKPYLIPLMTSNNSNSNDLINEIGRQFGEIGSKAVGLPKRLDENLERLEQGDLQLQIRLGESDRQLRRMIIAQQSMGQSILLGCLGISAALLGSNGKNIFALFPIAIALPITLKWLRLQMRIRRDENIERLQENKKERLT
ncbi:MULTISPECIES: ABC1 kinase family protein [unclassified Prochlorococcus]|uniref:ABC1 kinase family protein n=1 Tax=unclassified Prochlorococcus TaxID=2627481 RepID=UPI00053388B7|nr:MULTISPECIES: AarF/ABC1/UbiB kinase family protein [unclassified Prochlorococcus]KGG16726.1 Ubiquinone biosynthesis monooxygenase UbiB [Prochlorococcus sp. MIT 0602]KGG18301.1 Ubiquinone biosynthesis monooxygenase UbiB [Prochlorococcus sp. MIT 0603]